MTLGLAKEVASEGIDIATRMWDERFGGSSAALGMHRSHLLHSGDDADRVPFRPKESWLDRGAMAPKLEVIIGGFSSRQPAGNENHRRLCPGALDQ